MASNSVVVQLAIDGQQKVESALKSVQNSVKDTGSAVDYLNSKASGINKLGDSFASVGSAAGNALKNIAQVGIAATAAGAAAAGAFLFKGVQGVAQFEDYNVQFTTLIKNSADFKARNAGVTDALKLNAEASKDAAKEMENLSTFAATTPFELPQVVDAAKTLRGFGLAADDTAARFGFSKDEILRITGDVSAGTGADFQEMSVNIGKFSSGATGEAIARFQELGIVTKNELEGMGLNFDKGGSLIINSQQDLDNATGVVLEAMKGKYGGLMDAQSQTFNGMLSNVQDFIGQAGRTLSQPIFDKLKDGLKSAMDFIASPVGKVAIADLATKVGQAVDFMVAAFNKIAPIVGAAVGTVIEWIGTIVTAIQTNMPGIEDLGTVIGNVFSGISTVIGEVVGFISDNLDTVIAALTSFGQIAAQIIQGVISIFQSMEGTLGGILDVIAFALGKTNEAIKIFGVAWERAGKTVMQMSFLIEMAFTQMQNWIIDGINGIIRAVNFLIDGFNAVAGVVGIEAIPKIGELGQVSFNSAEALDRLGLAGDGAASGLANAGNEGAGAVVGIDAAGAAADRNFAKLTALRDALGGFAAEGTLFGNVLGAAQDKQKGISDLSKSASDAASQTGELMTSKSVATMPKIIKPVSTGGGGGGGGAKEEKPVDPLQAALDLASKLSAAGKALTEINVYKSISMEALTAFNNDMTALVKMFVAAASKFTTEAIKGSGEYIDAAGKIADAAGKMVGVLGKIKDYKSIAVENLTAFMEDTVSLSKAFMQAGQQFSIEMLQAGILYSQTVSAIGDGLGKMADGLIKIKDYAQLSKSSIDGFVADMRIMTEAFGRAGQEFPSAMLDSASKFATATNPLGETIGKFVDGLVKMKDYAGLSQRSIDMFVRDMRIMVEAFYRAGQEIPNELQKAAEEFAKSAGTVGDTLSKSVDAFVKIQDLKDIPAQKIQMLVDGIKLAVSLTQVAASTMENEMLEKVGLFGEATGKLFDGFSKAMTVFEGLQKYVAVAPNVIQSFVDNIIFTVTITDGLVQKTDKDLIERVSKFGDAVGKIFDNLKKAMDTFAGLSGMKNNPADGIKTLIDGIANAIIQMGGAQTKADAFLTAATNFANTMKQASDKIQEGLQSSGAASGATNSSTGGTNSNSTPKYASGTSFHPGGVALVGERGAELISMPRGTQVIPSWTTAAILNTLRPNQSNNNYTNSNANNYNLTINAPVSVDNSSASFEFMRAMAR